MNHFLLGLWQKPTIPSRGVYVALVHARGFELISRGCVGLSSREAIKFLQRFISLWTDDIRIMCIPSEVLSAFWGQIKFPGAHAFDSTEIWIIPRKRNHFLLDALANLLDSIIGLLYSSSVVGGASNCLNMLIAHTSTFFLVIRLMLHLPFFFRYIGSSLATSSWLLVMNISSIY